MLQMATDLFTWMISGDLELHRSLKFKLCYYLFLPAVLTAGFLTVSVVCTVPLLVEMALERNLPSVTRNYDLFEGWQLNCSHSLGRCKQLKQVSEVVCVDCCMFYEECVTTVYFSGGDNYRTCDIYSGTPFAMNMQPLQDEHAVMYIKKTETWPGVLHSDGQYYFSSLDRIDGALAPQFCHSVSPQYHVALIAFDEQDETLEAVQSFIESIIKEVPTERNNTELDSGSVIVYVLLGKTATAEESLADIAKKVSYKLKFGPDGPLNTKFSSYVVLKNGRLCNPNFLKKYYILCQADFFNKRGLSEFFLNLPKKITVGYGGEQFRRSLFSEKK